MNTLVLEGRGRDATSNWEGVGGRDPWSVDFGGEKFMCGGQEGGWRWFFVCLFTKKYQHDCGTEKVIWGICQNSILSYHQCTSDQFANFSVHQKLS